MNITTKQFNLPGGPLPQIVDKPPGADYTEVNATRKEIPAMKNFPWKRILAAALLVMMMLTLCACGGSSSTSGRTCPSCGRKVSSLVTKRDNAGVTYSWCSKCWSDYHAIAGY